MARADLIVAGKRVVIPDGIAPAAIVIRDGTITAVADYGAAADAARRVDVGDAAVLPGVVDTHVHVNEPGRTEWEGFETAVRAADPRARQPGAALGGARGRRDRLRGERSLAGAAGPEAPRLGRLQPRLGRDRVARAVARGDLDRGERARAHAERSGALARRAPRAPGAARAPQGPDRSGLRRRPRRMGSRRDVRRGPGAAPPPPSRDAVRRHAAARRRAADLRAGDVRVRPGNVSVATRRPMGEPIKRA